jgi:hypothetical protein
MMATKPPPTSPTIRMFLTEKSRVAATTGRREKSDHVSVEDAKASFARHHNRQNLEAFIYVDGAAAWFGECDGSGDVKWRPWHL